MGFVVRIDGVTLGHLDDAARRQLPFAMKNALNKTAQAVIEAEQAEMQTVFDTPRPYTLNSMFVREWATKESLTAVVDFKDGRSGRSASKYLAAQIHGGARRQKAIETVMINRGLMPAGYKIIPAAVKLDRGGNITLAAFRKMIKGVDDGTHFALLRQRGKLEPGLYIRTRRGVRQLIIFVSNATYDKRFRYFETAQHAVRQEFRAIFDAELSHALATAR